ncbi:hypothetical protein BGX38DRAFT_1096359 [Terfezia claveryi]|nr:hypothetical protein BGX38DRAFT_1096359 [Terfezia claveryi]
MVPQSLRRILFIPQATRFSIPHRTPVLANARPNFLPPSLPLRNHTSRSLSTSALRLLLQSPIGYAPSSTLASLSPKHLDPLRWIIKTPPICPGCGARSQTTEPGLPGFYDQERARAKVIKAMEKRNMDKKRDAEEATRLAHLARLEQGRDTKKFDFITRTIAAKPATSTDCPAATPAPASTDFLLTAQSTAATPKLPLCERCKSLLNHDSCAPIHAYPDLDTLIDLISESKHEKNHIYHLIDAADFPLSLIPRLKSYLAQYLPPKKARNLSVSYVITRADLLMPKEEQVTSLMTYLKGVLKDALPPGEAIEDHHSPWGGSFRVISIRNAWSIRRVKAEFSHMAGLKLSKAEKGIVKSREGGIWIVGKANVGKSRFVGEIVPEGSFTNLERVIGTVSGPRASYSPELETLTREEKLKEFLKKVEGKERVKNPEITKEELAKILEEAQIKIQNEELDQEELPLVSPTISNIPGTTVAPVRVAFRHPGENGRKGGVKGEIIDLPGMERGRFLDFVRPKLRRKVQMECRVDPKQYVVKPGQSLVLAGLIMIQPKTRGTDFMMYPYTALPTHVTATEKALEFMNHPDPEGNKPVSAPLPGTLPENIKSAGTFHLSSDVTRLRNPQLRGKSDAEIELLPYKIYSTDILLEGVGWVEIVAQIRTHQVMMDVVPEVEVFTPLGKGVGSRKPMGADMLRLQGLKKIGKYGVRRSPTEGRQRPSMKGRKKQSKINHRASTGGRG